MISIEKDILINFSYKLGDEDQNVKVLIQLFSLTIQISIYLFINTKTGTVIISNNDGKELSYLLLT